MELDWIWWGYEARVWLTQVLMLAAAIAGLWQLLDSRQANDSPTRVRKQIMGIGLLLGAVVFFTVLWLGGGYLIGS